MTNCPDALRMAPPIGSGSSCENEVCPTRNNSPIARNVFIADTVGLPRYFLAAAFAGLDSVLAAGLSMLVEDDDFEDSESFFAAAL